LTDRRAHANRLTAKTLRRFDLTRPTVYKALANLESAGLIRVSRKAGCPLAVTILPAPPEKP
jgi:hypothetical protein